MTWRLAHHWLRGYSDAKAGKPVNPLPHHDPGVYRAGYATGRGPA